MNFYLSSAYLAPVQYYSKLLQADSVFIECCENYQKQSYRNRCKIMTANGEMSLSIPVIHSSSAKVLTKDIRIADHDNWQHNHWNAIVSAYNSTPFFEYYQDDFYPFYHKKYDFLFDFNEELRALVSDLLNIGSANIYYTDSYKLSFDENELDFRDLIHPKKDWRTLDADFITEPYYQVFEDKYTFVPNLSIIDLLFNMGNESLIVLHRSFKNKLS